MVGLFALLAGGLLALVFYVVFARATVIVMSKPESVEVEFIVDVAKQAAPDEIAGGVVTASESVEKASASVSLVSLDTPAEGRVNIVSSLARAQTLLATTRLATADNRLFRTRETVTVPAFGQVQVDIYAAEPGLDGAVGQASFVIPGLNDDTRRHFAVKTVAPVSGGKKEIKVVTAEAASVLESALKEELSRKLDTKLDAAAGAQGQFGGRLITLESNDRTVVPPIGSEAENFNLTLSARAVGVFYDQAQLLTAIRRELSAKLPAGRRLSEVLDAETAVALEKADLPSGRANLRVRAKGLSVLAPSAFSADKLTGITAEAAKRYLEKIDGVASASVTIRPFWASRLPSVARNIRVEIR
ncbi:hypothetical protein A3C96_03695 [Candidatus Uhrbacteria bacterium RIFCSPHIGHO2_02_FULL_60_10]|uniref:Baseplate protein J-like domain-containing protein n=1 Tax=Candidatus Uhrbacteria bacterium RIFCSPHIGHO2_02_FULL_60_10 TaxID=1802392 RepID=A0A1F7U4J8_9BACT|nr:MAG: hypothetical protein A3C96_03695 [Candidatus Uhrbacteria bacterium RIFCSPHIGHO2_02_FULL_60_10]